MNMFNMTQLDILGFTHEYRLLLITVIGLTCLFSVMKVIIDFLSHRNYVAVLTYLMSTFLLMNALLLSAFFLNNSSIIKMGLEGVAFFGFFYAMYLLYRKMTHSLR